MSTASDRRVIAQTSCDVLVIGAGPAGSAVALRLARQGWQVLLLERRVFGAAGCDPWRSGEGFPPRTQREIAALDAGLEPNCWRQNTIRRLLMRWPSGYVTQDRFGGQRCIEIVAREAFDAACFTAARRGGVDGRQGWQARQLVRDARGDVVGALVSDPEGRPHHISARLVIDAGGRNARSLTQFGLRRPLAGPTFLAVVLFVAQLPDVSADRWEMHLFGTPLCVLQITTLAPGVIGCGLGAPLACRRSGETPQAFFWRLIGSDPLLRSRFAGVVPIRAPFTRARLAYRVAPIVLPGLLLVGDATGYVSPLFGDGVWSALRSAAIAAEVAGQALRHGDVSARRLSAYAHRWQAARRGRFVANLLLTHTLAYPRALEAIAAQRWSRALLLHSLLRA
ncbi:NAD(P)/FAD-dependent oxidoreductase [Kallotenue papyrolyticum]|uniref:NAD(P)/FAD-dependent oxidoreductase n=1 Tax=Kallotenue papyrolyticum TaxID=1325125 RepID=UPI0012695F29|nr:NAD(P)/FAD-dependent oxidoreductase [Kallotenue papyrolyticum]